MKHPFSIAVVALSMFIQLANADPQTERIRKAAEENSAALAVGNYGRVVDFTYPKVVEMVGGRDKMIETLHRGSEEMKAHGSAILGAEVTQPREIITVGDKQFAIVPMTVRVEVPKGTLQSKGFLIAISTDRGNTWTFIDGAGVTKEKLAQSPSRVSVAALVADARAASA
jgi:hypothetical protein